MFFLLSWVVGICYFILHQSVNMWNLYSWGCITYIIVMKNKNPQGNSYDQPDVYLGLFLHLSLFLLLPNTIFLLPPIPFCQTHFSCLSLSCLSTCYFLPLPPLPFCSVCAISSKPPTYSSSHSWGICEEGGAGVSSQ